MKEAPVTSCYVTSFYVANPPSDGITGPHHWMAVATAHVFDDTANIRGLASKEAVVLSGAAMRVIHGRVTADSQEVALKGALHALLYQLKIVEEPD